MATRYAAALGIITLTVAPAMAGVTESVSVGPGGVLPNGNSDRAPPVVSADGRYVAFSSLASNLIASDTNNTTDVFVRDRVAGTTERVSVSTSGSQANSFSGDGVVTI